jgi:hypothetical protein
MAIGRCTRSPNLFSFSPPPPPPPHCRCQSQAPQALSIVPIGSQTSALATFQARAAVYTWQCPQHLRLKMESHTCLRVRLLANRKSTQIACLALFVL